MRTATRLLSVCLLVALACADPAIDPGAAARNPDGRWTEIPEGPLSARRSANAFAVDGILYVIGGTEADPCPPTADCVEPEEGPRNDGAAFDPATNEWKGISEAPVPIGYASGVAIGDSIYMLTYATVMHGEDAFLEYSTADDRWTRLPLPPKPDYRRLVPFGENLIAYQSSQENGIDKDFVFDVATRQWSALPVDPLAATFDRSMVWTGDEIVLLGLPNVPNPGAERPSLYGVAILDANRRWRRLPDSGVGFTNPNWHFAAGKVVNSSIVTIDGGETGNYGRDVPTGGIFDPHTERWSELPNPPEQDYAAYEDHITGIYIGGDNWVTAGDGWAFDVAAGDWAPLLRPDGAPESEIAATWVGDHLAIWGGVSWDGSEGRLHADGWLWEAPE